ncbi:phosphoribosyltransferase [Devosia naphthalenivorans]|uniref:phosphoribosyltransferase n=1 Tax=Devosia naphthalenivorans TaxID=2082392 RepID=UPI000D359DDE|nr:phosphoribosyltransferase [Devosia naphthalenivorans]
MHTDTQYFIDRHDAGRMLAEALVGKALDNPIVLALPRGGVPVAFEVARALGAEMDLLIVRKIGAPNAPEYGIGAVVGGAHPQVVLNQDAMDSVRPSPDYVWAETDRQFAEVERRREAYLGQRPPAELAGRTVIVIDDGVATGGSAKAALLGIRQSGAARIIFAVPVGPSDKIDELAQYADEVLCLYAPKHFQAVGLHYADFSQTTDEQVKHLLETARPTSAKTPPPL